MRVLLDTHALLWFLTGDARLSRFAHRGIADSGTDVFVSAASLWEAVVKASLGKLPLPEPFEEILVQQLAGERIEVLPVEMSHLAVLRTLPFHHRDPFDRLLIAQAMAERRVVVTRDVAFETYGVPLLWNDPAA